jgi:hypothetical protein
MRRQDCEFIRPLISAFFDGDLSPSESMELHQHLASCDGCRRIFDEYQRIRSGFRELPPSPPPPPDLARSVWSETVDRTPPSRLRRIVGETTTRVGLATAAVLAVIIVISAFLLVRGYNQNLPPTATYTVAQSGQSWPIYRPIEITFNKPMDKTSVEENLKITPPGERDRIPLSWDHNTLIIGASSSESALFLPDTNYQVVVLAGALDSYGQALADPVQITFRTSAIADTAGTPTSVPSGTSNVTATAGQNQQSANLPPPPSSVSSSSSSTGQGTTTPSQPAATATPTKSPAPSPTPAQVPGSPTGSGNTVHPATPTPTAQPTQPAATPTSASSGTPAATATPAGTPTQAATPIVSDQTPDATPVASATTNTGTPTSNVVPVTGAFGSVYWANTDVQKKLGDAQAPEAHMSASELGFQHGTMYERFDTNEIYVLLADNQWRSFPDTWTAAEGEGGGPGPQENLWIPKGSFGKVWNSDPNLQQNIGYAVNSAAPHVMGGVVQQFANGIMLYSDQGFVYVVYDDGSWAPYPDTSGHGDLITPTPTSSETPTATPAEATTPEATEPVTPTPATP